VRVTLVQSSKLTSDKGRTPYVSRLDHQPTRMNAQRSRRRAMGIPRHNINVHSLDDQNISTEWVGKKVNNLRGAHRLGIKNR